MPQHSNAATVLDLLRREQAVVGPRIVMALDAAGYEMVDLARSTTSQMRPPVRRDEGPRASHPGGWADVTGGTAASIRHTAEQVSASRFSLTIEAGGAARFLERRGYWVLSGLFSGGHVNESVRRHLSTAFSAP